MSRVPSNGRKTPGLGQPSGSHDRYTYLQKRLEDLEKVHADDKRAHRTELERLKGDLVLKSKIATDQSAELEKLKKRNDSLEARLSELKKSHSSEQGQITEWKDKLRAAEREVRELRSKTAEAGDTKRMDARRKEEIRERERRIAELQRELESEKKRREAAEARVREGRGKVEVELAETKKANQALAEELRSARQQTKDASAALMSLKETTVDSQDSLLTQLDSMKELLNHAIAEYASLRASSVFRSEYDALKTEKLSLRLNCTRLERKLADSQAQAVELASLVRHAREDSALLKECLTRVEQEASWYGHQLRDAYRSEPANFHAGIQALEDDLTSAEEQDAAVRRRIGATLETTDALLTERQRLLDEQMIFHYSSLDHQLRDTEAHLHERESELEEARALAPELLSAKQRLAEQAVQLAEALTTRQLAEVRAADAEALARDTQSRLASDLAAKDRQLALERDSRERMAQTARRCKAAEEALRDEMEALGAELAHAQQYEDAYRGLTEQVQALIDRNALAEEEASALSRFNAEILGHHNPAQRILYVDRIRKELAEAKLKLAQYARQQEVAQEQNQDLLQELDLYRSVAIPQEHKPRTHITRVSRVPLANQSLNLGSLVQTPEVPTTVKTNSGASLASLVQTPEVPSTIRTKSGARLPSLFEEDLPSANDMTLDELL